MSQIACVSGDRLLIEGLFSELQRITLVEGLWLEVKGSNGILRMDMTEDELKRAQRMRQIDSIFLSPPRH